MASAHSRRAFLGALVARRLPEEPPRRRRPAAPPARATLDAAQVHARASALGLDVSTLLERSLRLTPAPDGVATRSWVGGRPDLPAGFAWPRDAGGAPLPFAAQVERPSGLLLFFAGAGAAHVARVAKTAGGGGGGERVVASAEWSLPRAWSAPVVALGLDDAQREAYNNLRAGLAREQGVQLHEDVPGVLELHRLFGHPDDTRGDGPLTCELLDAGLPIDDLWAHAEREAPAARRWRLLLQLTHPAPGVERLTFWIPREDLAAGDFTRVRALFTHDPEHPTP
jgi:hypothetical protein